MNILATIVGLLVGLFLVVDGIAGWGLAGTVRPAPKTELRVSEVVIGGLFVVLAILTMTGVINIGA